MSEQPAFIQRWNEEAQAEYIESLPDTLDGLMREASRVLLLLGEHKGGLAQLKAAVKAYESKRSQLDWQLAQVKALLAEEPLAGYVRQYVEEHALPRQKTALHHRTGRKIGFHTVPGRVQITNAEAVVAWAHKRPDEANFVRIETIHTPIHKQLAAYHANEGELPAGCKWVAPSEGVVLK